MNGCRVDLVPAVMRGWEAGSLTWLRASMKITRGLVLGLDSMLQHIIDAESSSFGMLQFCPNTHTCKSNTPWSQYSCAPNKIFGGVAVPSITCMGIQHQRVCMLCAPNAESLGVLKFRPARAGLTQSAFIDPTRHFFKPVWYIYIYIYIYKNIRWRTWFTENGQMVTITGQIHGCL